MTRNVFFLLLVFGALSSCSDDVVQKKSNMAFQKKFGADVAKINAERLPPPPPNNFSEDAAAIKPRQATGGSFASPNELLGVSGSAQYSSAAVDTTKFSLKRVEDFSPNEQTITAAKAAGQNKLPDDMFDLIYNTELSPPFVVSGLEFDTIKIPERDYYGVASTLNDKRYSLAGNNILQKNIDSLIRSRSIEDVEFSKIIIKEQKQLKKQQKLAKIFGEDSSFVKEEKVKSGTYVEKAEKAPELDDQIKKAIALQVIKQNVSNNSASGAAQNKGMAIVTNAAASPKTQ